MTWETSADGVRLLKHVRITDGCWEWTAHKDAKGYGMCGFRGKSGTRAHRAFYMLAVGPIPDGLVLDHLCRNRGCVRPSHLEAVTSRVNTLRGETLAAKQLARSHCAKGHEYTPETTRYEAHARRCLICERRHGQNARNRKISRLMEVAVTRDRFFPTPYDAARVVKVLVPDVALAIRHHGGDREDIWSKAKARKDNRCNRCWGGISKGEAMWRPLTFKDHRSARICVACVGQIERNEDRKP